MANILHISRTMDIGGAEKIVYQLATDLKEEFDSVHIASTGGLWEDELKKQGIQHHKILDVESKSPKTLAKNFKILSSIIKKHKIDIIHTHHRMAAFYARLLKYLFPKIKHVYTAHNIFDNRLKLYKYSVQGARVIAVSIAVKEHLKKQLNLNNVEIIYNGIKVDNSKETSSEVTDFTGVKIGFIGRLDYQKGVEDLPKSDVIQIVLEDETYLTVRPSGTEPKIKFYISVVDSDKKVAEEKLAKLEKEFLNYAENL